MTIAQHKKPRRPVAAEPYDAKVLGAPFQVLLAEGFRKKTDPISGKEKITIDDLGGLIAKVVQTRVLHRRKLSGADLKFIRSALCVKSGELAKILDLTPEHYSRCEAGTKVMSGATEKAFRMYAFLSVAKRDITLVDYVPSDDEKAAMSAEDGQKAIEAFRRIFLDMNIFPVHDAGEELVFVFHRRCRSYPEPCADDEGEWIEPPIAATA